MRRGASATGVGWRGSVVAALAGTWAWACAQDRGLDSSGAPRGTPAALLEAALDLKEKRRLDDAVEALEGLAPGGAAAATRAAGVEGRSGAAVCGKEATAAAVVAELEAIDGRLRLGSLAGLEGRLERLGGDWPANAEVMRRVRALRALLLLRDGPLLEPNAISRADLGERFAARYFRGKPGREAPPIPLDLALRFLSELSPEPGALPGRGSRPRVAAVVGFLRLEDLAAERREAWKPAVEHFDRDPRALTALFVYTGGEEPPPGAPDQEPWSRLAVFWIRGSFAALESAPEVRTRYEWLPGPTFFLLEPGGKLRSWKWPHEGWEGFQIDVRQLLEGRPAPERRARR